MKTRYCILQLLLFVSFFTISKAQQQWAPDSAVWNHAIRFIDVQPTTPFITNIKTTVLGDTFFQGRICRALQRQTTSPSGQTAIPDTLITWQDSFKVYYWSGLENSFLLGYDFSAQPGDTLHFSMCSFRVLSAGFEIIGPDTLRYYTLESGWQARNYEKIGSLENLFLWYHCNTDPLGDLEIELYCYQEPQLGLFSTGLAPVCGFFGLSTKTDLSKINLKIFSLENEWLIETSPEQKFTSIRIIDLSGKILSETTQRPSFRISVPNESLPSGIYIFEAELNSGNHLTGKLLNSE